MLTDQEVQHGYWGARRLAGKLPQTYYLEPSEYKGEDALCFFKAPASTLSPAQERKRTARWCEALPHMKLKTLILECKVGQPLFDAATKIAGLEALWVQHSSCTSNYPASEFSAVRAALPSLKYGSPFKVHMIRELCGA